MLAVQTRYYPSQQQQQQHNMTPIDLDQWMEDFADFLADVSKGSPATGMSDDIYRNLMQYSYRTDGIKRLRKELQALESRARILNTASTRVGAGGGNKAWIIELQTQLEAEQQSKRQLVAQHARDLEHFQLSSSRESDEFHHLESKIKQLKAQTKAQDVKIQALEDSKLDMQNEHALLILNFDRAQTELSNRKGPNGDVLRVQANYIKDLERVRDAKLQEFKDLDQRMLKERKDYRDLLNDRNELRDQKDALETAYRDVVSQHTALRNRNQDLENRMKTVGDGKAYRDLATEHANFRNMNQELESSIKATRKANRELSTECKTLRGRCSELEGAVKNNHKAHRDFLAEFERVRARNAELEADLQNRKEAFDVLGSHSEGLQRTIDSLQDRRERLEQEYDELSGERETLMAQVRGLEGEKKALEGTTTRLRGLAKQIQDASGNGPGDPMLALGMGGGGGPYDYPALLPLRVSASEGQLDARRPYLITAPLVGGSGKSDKKASTSGSKRGRSRASKSGTVVTTGSIGSKASKGSWTR